MKRWQVETPIGHEDAVLLLPWYVTGRLDERDTQRIQRHIAGCEDCGAEVLAQRSLKDSIRGAPAVEYAPQASLARLMDLVDAHERRRSKWGRWLPLLSPRSPRRSARAWIRTLTIATGVQALAIVMLLGVVGWFAMRVESPSIYRTLTSNEVAAPVGSVVRVVFDESMRIDEMQAMLRAAGAHIVSGPTAQGAYTIRVDAEREGGQSAEQAAKRLRSQPGVRFAEPVLPR